MCIGIAPAHKNQLSNYTSWLDKRGISYKILKEGDTLRGCTMLLLCGGPDVDQLSKRDLLEISWLKEAYSKMPVLGICRGLQISNVVLGGTLFEDLSSEKVKHTSNKTAIAGEPQPLLESSYHDIVFEDGKRIRVNSRHHQGIKDLAPGLKPLARCSDDDLLEMVEGDKSLFVQWHPERPDVWGTEAEQIVYDWLHENFKPLSHEDMVTQLDNDFQAALAKAPVELILSYMKKKGFNVVSNDRIRKSILDESFTDTLLEKLILDNPRKLKLVKDKANKLAIKKM